MLYVDYGNCFNFGLPDGPDLGGGIMNMKGGCDCYDCKYYKEVFMDDFDEWWMFCRKQQCVISVGMRATCELGVSKDDGQDN